jgi:hypothetical protein
MDIIVSFCVLGIYNMANDLKHISSILQEVYKDLKELNDKYDEQERKKNESATTLRPSNDATTSTRITTTGEKDEL